MVDDKSPIVQVQYPNEEIEMVQGIAALNTGFQIHWVGVCDASVHGSHVESGSTRSPLFKIPYLPGNTWWSLKIASSEIAFFADTFAQLPFVTSFAKLLRSLFRGYWPNSGTNFNTNIALH